MQVRGDCCHGTVAERALDEVDWHAMVERVAGVRVSKPVRRHRTGDATPLGRLLDDPAHTAAVQRLSALDRKYRLLGGRFSSERVQFRPECRGRRDRSRPATFAEYRDLAGVPSSPEITPAQLAGLDRSQLRNRREPVFGQGVGKPL